jgi:hypothetical protein
MKPTRIRATIARPADNTAYAAGDEISNHATAGSVVRAEFNLSGFTRGKIYSAEVDLTAASGNVVTTAGDFEILLFRYADAPGAVGDNVTNPIAANIRSLAVAQFRLDDTGWTGPLGTVAAGTSQSQSVMAHLVQPLATPVLQAPYYPGFFFDFTGSTTRSLVMVIRAVGAWTPTGVVNTFGVTLDLEAE